MAYVAVTGGSEAIEQSLRLLEMFRESGEDISISCIKENMGLLIDKIMSEAGFYSRDYAALALKQCEGSVEEAVFLLRAYRSTLPRNYYSNTVDTGDMRLIRRISAAFKDIPGDRFWGRPMIIRTVCWTFRSWKEKVLYRRTRRQTILSGEDIRCGRVTDMLRAEGVMAAVTKDDTPPV